MYKKPNFFIVFWIIMKCSLISFGGGNAIFPVLKTEIVEKRPWLTTEEFNDLIVKTNLLPGASVVQAFTYISIKLLGFWLGMLLSFLATLPHVILFFVIFWGISYLPERYLWIVSIAVLPTIAGIVLAFTVQFMHKNIKSLHPIIFWTIFLISFLVTIFLPTPFNAPVFVMIIIILYAVISQSIAIHRAKKKIVSEEQND